MQFDFIVVGAGMAGASIADALATAGPVALLEAEPHPGYHTTGRSAALFAPNYGSPTFTALTRASREFFGAAPAEFFAAPLLRPRGALYLARAAQRARLAAEVATMRAHGAEIEELTPGAARAQLPLLRPGYLAAAALERAVYDIDVEALFQGFLRRGRARGVRLLTNQRLEEPPQRHGGLWQLKAGAEVLAAPVVVNAAGAWADQVAALCGAAPLGMQVLRRSAAIIDAPAGVDVSAWPAVFDINEEFYLKPDAGRLLISPADEEPVRAGDAYAEDLAIALAVERIQQALDLEVERVRRSWAGLRTFAPDRDPVIGYDGGVEGFFWCVGQGGYGIQTAPALARLAAALACRTALPAEVVREGVSAASVTPARFR